MLKVTWTIRGVGLGPPDLTGTHCDSTHAPCLLLMPSAQLPAVVTEVLSEGEEQRPQMPGQTLG